MDLKKLKVLGDRKCLLQHQNMPPSLENSFHLVKALEGLVLDLQVVSADLRNLQGLLSNIESQLQVLEVSVQGMQSRKECQ